MGFDMYPLVCVVRQRNQSPCTAAQVSRTTTETWLDYVRRLYALATTQSWSEVVEPYLTECVGVFQRLERYWLKDRHLESQFETTLSMLPAVARGGGVLPSDVANCMRAMAFLMDILEAALADTADTAEAEAKHRQYIDTLRAQADRVWDQLEPYGLLQKMVTAVASHQTTPRDEWELIREQLSSYYLTLQQDEQDDENEELSTDPDRALCQIAVALQNMPGLLEAGIRLFRRFAVATYVTDANPYVSQAERAEKAEHLDTLHKLSFMLDELHLVYCDNDDDLHEQTLAFVQLFKDRYGQDTRAFYQKGLTSY